MSKMQNRNFNQYKAWKSNYYQRARRKDAEPIIQKFIKLRITGSFYFALQPPEQAIWLS